MKRRTFTPTSASKENKKDGKNKIRKRSLIQNIGPNFNIGLTDKYLLTRPISFVSFNQIQSDDIKKSILFSFPLPFWDEDQNNYRFQCIYQYTSLPYRDADLEWLLSSLILSFSVTSLYTIHGLIQFYQCIKRFFTTQPTKTTKEDTSKDGKLFSIFHFIEKCFYKIVNVCLYGEISLSFSISPRNNKLMEKEKKKKPIGMPVFFLLLLFAEFLLSCLIVKKIRYTEIDWTAYMKEVEYVIEKGEYDYINIETPQGKYDLHFFDLYIFLNANECLASNTLRNR